MRLQPSIQATSSLRSMYSGTVLNRVNWQVSRSYSDKSKGSKKGETTCYSQGIPLVEELWTAHLAPSRWSQPWCGLYLVACLKLIWMQDITRLEVRVMPMGYSGEPTPWRWKHAQICKNKAGLSRTWNQTVLLLPIWIHHSVKGINGESSERIMRFAELIWTSLTQAEIAYSYKS